MRQTDETMACYLNILQEELVPAMGCTEPIAVAYAAAKAREVLGEAPTSVLVKASGSIIKNVKSVIVPNTDRMKGIDVAAAAGIVAGKPERELEVISGVTPKEVKAIRAFVKKTPITVEALDGGCVFDIVVTLETAAHSATLRIANHHTNIVHIEKDGHVLLDAPVQGDGDESLAGRAALSMRDIWQFANEVPLADIRPILRPQITHNWAIAEEGMRRPWGASVGKVMLASGGDGVRNRAMAMAAAGSDARMAGCDMPVVINAGSGNQGITVSVPVIVYAKALGAGEEQLLRALALANLTAIYIKSGIGRLSAYCGAAGAGAAAAAGIAFLHGGGYDAAVGSVTNALAIISGMICDGAKGSCAAKIAMAVNAGIMGYELFTHGQQFHGGDGIVTSGIDGTIQNVCTLAKDGMDKTNEVIIDMMTRN